MTIEDARAYVGTTPLSGVAQFGALALSGLTSRGTRVLEYGCGTLHLARVLVPFLERGCYCGIEPNRWLVDAALDAEPGLRAVIREREVQIAARDDFDASCFDRKFDFVFAHSVLSHASASQLDQFFLHAACALRRGGSLVASYREGLDSDDIAWQYPGVSWFSLDSIDATAERNGFGAVLSLPNVRRFYMAACPDEVHDWFLCRKLT